MENKNKNQNKIKNQNQNKIKMKNEVLIEKNLIDMREKWYKKLWKNENELFYDNIHYFFHFYLYEAL